MSKEDDEGGGGGEEGRFRRGSFAVDGEFLTLSRKDSDEERSGEGVVTVSVGSVGT